MISNNTFSPMRTRSIPPPERKARSHPLYGSLAHIALALLATISLIAALPETALAHTGSVQPAATDYLARISRVPAGLDAKIVDGDLRLWLRVPAGETAIVRDYRGAPYLRFDRTGVQVNHNSAMYYLNQTPVAETPPTNLTASTPPDWASAGGSHEYNWHDGRLHALAAIALAPGTSYVGTWSIPVIIDGRPTAISGGLWHANRPTIVWFWPIFALFACVIAATRLRRPSLDVQLARALGLTGLVALGVAGVGRELRGHPDVSPTQYVELGIILAFVIWALYRLLFQRHGYFTYFIISLAMLWEGLSLIAILRDGFVLIDLPAFVARTATMLCLACGAAILVPTIRLADLPERTTARRRPTATHDPDPEDLDEAWGIG